MTFSRLFQLVLETTIMSSILAVLILLVKVIFSKRLDARWHYAVWLLLILRLLMPYSIHSPLSIYNYTSPGSAIFENSVQSSSIQYPSQGQDNTKSTSAKEDVISTNNPKGQDNSIQIQGKAAKNSSNNWLMLLSILWAAGASASFLFIIFTGTIFYMKMKSETVVTDEKLLVPLSNCKEKLDIKKAIPIIVTRQIKNPCLYGICRPKILLPENALHKICRDDLEYIFLHELSHYKRRDILAN